jgi:hypothetical protein
MQIDNLFVDEQEKSPPNMSEMFIYLIFALVTNNDKKGSVFGLNTVLDECVHTRINYFFHHFLEKFLVYLEEKKL